MLTPEEAISRLEDIEREIGELKKAFQEGWNEAVSEDPTQVFLDKCGGWKDTRSPEEIVAEIYASRTISHRDANLFNDESL
jgi:hypothetical protein